MNRAAKDHFKKVDPILASLAVSLDPVTPSKDFFVDLCEIIVQQQLSEKAGDTIWQRFLRIFKRLTPQSLLRVPDQKIRDAGISWSKISYLKNIAKANIDFKKLIAKNDQDIIDELTKVKGIGPWSAEMFLMFSLGREDVFSYGDLGLRNAIKKLYKFKDDPSRAQMEKLSKKWVPYRTWAARLLWKSLELS